MTRTVFLAGLLLLAGMAQAQALLTAEEAVRLALEKNFDIAIVRYDAEIAKTNNTRANAGMTPTVNLVASDNFAVNAFQQKLRNGSEFNAVGATFNTFNAGVQLNWNLYDGGRMYIAKRRLEAQEKLGELNLQLQVQNTTAAVLQAYYDIVFGKMQEKALREVIVLNEERLRIAEARLAAGFAAQTDALQAKIDLNQRRSDLIARENLTSNAVHLLNRLLVRDVNTAFVVPDTLVSNWSPDPQNLIQKIMQQNPALVSLQQNAQIAALNVDEAGTLGMPRVNGISQFNLVRSDNGAGFLLNNTQGGLTIGGTFTMPLYTGGNLRRQEDVAALAAKQANLRVEQQKQALETELANQIAFYESQRNVMALEAENIKAARENLNISTARFRVGTTNGLEPQTAQNTLEQALARRNTVLYNLTLAEVRLKLLAGEL